MSHPQDNARHRVVLLGGGFGGLYAAQSIPSDSPIEVTLIDKRNFHLFQPLLYQVATGGLSPGDIASPLRAILAKRKNVTVLQVEAIDLDIAGNQVVLKDGAVPYDTLIIATGASHHYFGHDDWAAHAPGLKTVEDALAIRQKIFSAFEKAERETNEENRRALLTFLLIGGGPTGVEMAGALAELAHDTLKGEFKRIDPTWARIVLIEGVDRILPPYPEKLSEKARASLEKLGVEVRTGTLVTEVRDGAVTMKRGEETETIEAATIFWAAGVQASPVGKILAAKTGASLDRAGRVLVEKDLTVPGHPEIFVIGDLANFSHQGGKPLPGIAPVAMQQGRYVADLVQRRINGAPQWPFVYQDKGSLAVIGRNAAVADLGNLRFSGFPAWLLWVFVHIRYLIEFDNKALVLFQWAWNYLTRKRGARLITNE
ncbi:MAG TPA: NAD(P)/FAD-dependent oxidoreductase [bacterium]|nr:NAD(P)/FAD-dependent oxidoreductase [bacterium]